MSKHQIPGGDRARCILCDRQLYVFWSSPWPECVGVRQWPHAGRPMAPVRELTKPRPRETVPAPVGPKFTRPESEAA